MKSIIIEFIVAPEIFDAITMFVKPNTTKGHILLKADTTKDPTAALAGGIIFGHLLNTLPKDGTAYQASTGAAGQAG